MNKRRRIGDSTATDSGTSRENAIDLTTPPRYPRPIQRNIPSFSQRERPYMQIRPSMANTSRTPVQAREGVESPSPPSWQPDAAVDDCPVCHTAFGLWTRKHHCRKCGRVVCSACSPHRITIPRQYIVTPYESAHHSELGGGEVVRVCNPCVPDPWVPPGSPAPAATATATTASATVDIPHAAPPTRYRSGMQPPHPQRHRSLTYQAPPQAPTGHSVSNSVSNSGRTNQSSSMASSAYLSSRYRRHHAGHPSASSSAPSAPPMQPPLPRPRRQIAEEDECPVCGCELPPGENSRENHVRACVLSRFSTSSGSPGGMTPLAPPGGETLSNPLPLPPYRPRGMAVFHATEKDCIAEEDGQLPECQICLDEFEVGQELGRMECLCKFHRKCIRSWWNTKGTGSCPTHQLHD